MAQPVVKTEQLLLLLLLRPLLVPQPLLITSLGTHSLGMSRWTKAEDGMDGKSSCMIILTASRSSPSESANRTIFFLLGDDGGDLCVLSDVLLTMFSAMVVDIVFTVGTIKRSVRVACVVNTVNRLQTCCRSRLVVVDVKTFTRLLKPFIPSKRGMTGLDGWWRWRWCG